MDSLVQGLVEDCVELTGVFVDAAEKELAAYARAVRELFGSEQARQSTEDWMAELESMDWPGRDAAPDWRGVTIRAAARLAHRVNLQSQIHGLGGVGLSAGVQRRA
jgi:hypothetical protein